MVSVFDQVGTNYYSIILAVVCIILFSYAMTMRGGSEEEEVVTERKVVAADYTAEDVSKHTKEEDAWIIVEGKVYDITPYIGMHPGGEAAILKYAGKDASKPFRGPQHGSQVDDVIANYYIGQLVK